MHELSVGKKSPAVRSVSINMSTNVSKHYNKNVPVGSVFCHNHLKSERILIQTKTSTATNKEYLHFIMKFAEVRTALHYRKAVCGEYFMLLKHLNENV